MTENENIPEDLEKMISEAELEAQIEENEAHRLRRILLLKLRNQLRKRKNSPKPD